MNFKICGNNGTGFLCKIFLPDESNLLPVLISNNHVLSEKDNENIKKVNTTINNDF